MDVQKNSVSLLLFLAGYRVVGFIFEDDNVRKLYIRQPDVKLKKKPSLFCASISIIMQKSFGFVNGFFDFV